MLVVQCLTAKGRYHMICIMFSLYGSQYGVLYHISFWSGPDGFLYSYVLKVVEKSS